MKSTPNSDPSAAPTFWSLAADGVIVRFSLTPDPVANAAAQVFAAQVSAIDLPGLIEVVPSLASVLVQVDPMVMPRTEVIDRLKTLANSTDWTAPSLPKPSRRWTIPAAFGGAYGGQIGEAAACAGLSAAEALAELTQARLRVLAIGFAPGQPYLGLLPEHWNIPRQNALTPMVPAGALVVAVRQVVLFANPSPTGWRQVGQTAFRPFRPERSEPFPLRVGDEVVFEAVAHSEFTDLIKGDAAGADTARLEVLA